MSLAIRTFALCSLISLGCVALTAAAQTVVITTKPGIERRGQFSYLVIADTNHSFDISLGMPPDMPFIPVSLDTNRVYTFTVAQKPFHSITIPRLRKVQLSGQTIYDIEVCEVHKTKMEHKEVQIVYGLILPGRDGPSADTERRLFPRSREYSLGGCIVGEEKTTEMYVCSACKEALAWWSGTATAPHSVMPRNTRYDHDQRLRLTYLEAFGKAYVAAWARKESLPVFGPTSEEDKAKVFGYADGATVGRTARDAWTGANGQRYGP
jgi:hypothetical protein